MPALPGFCSFPLISCSWCFIYLSSEIWASFRVCGSRSPRCLLSVSIAAARWFNPPLFLLVGIDRAVTRAVLDSCPHEMLWKKHERNFRYDTPGEAAASRLQWTNSSGDQAI